MKKFLIPLALFFVLVVFLAIGLKRDPKEIPSPLMGRVAPAFTLPTLDPNAPAFDPQQMRGQVWMLNVWATWCVACRQEHPLLVAFSKANQLPIVGLNYKEVQAQDLQQGAQPDTAQTLAIARQKSTAWLQRFGNPYAVSVFDLDGRVGINYGVYGVPETYLIDQAGVIRYKQIGVLTPEVLTEKILPLVKALNAS
jgi:cytochrome c biogenesis protein CcmG, thiol:disulfide interchange protein DsbE